MELSEIKRPRGPSFKVRVFRAGEQRVGAPALIIAPAMGVPASYYDIFATALAADGFHTVVSDLRGNGDSGVRAGRGSDFGYWDMVSIDWPAVVDFTRHRFGDRIALVGHSLGGHLNMIYAALNPGSVAALVQIASSTVHFKAWPKGKRLGMLGFAQVAGMTARALGYFPGHRFKFAGIEARTVITDWARLARTGRFDIAHCPHDVEAALREMQKPVLAVSVEGDWLAPVSAVEGLVAKMPKARVTRWHFDPKVHGLSGIDHFRWAKQPEQVVLHMASWLLRQG